MRLLAAVLVLVLAGPAWSHFIWLVPEKKADEYLGTALLVFSDTPAPDDNVPISKVASARVFARGGAKGEPVEVKKTDAKDAYRLAPEGKELILLGAECPYGVSTRAEPPALVVFYAKTVVLKGLPSEPATWLFEGTPKLALEIVPHRADPKGPRPKGAQHQVLWQGKPAANVEVTLLPPGGEKVVRTTDEQGLFEVAPPKKGGVYGMRAKLVEKKAGEHEGKRYQEVRHFSTLTFAINDWFVPGEKKEKK